MPETEVKSPTTTSEPEKSIAKTSTAITPEQEESGGNWSIKRVVTWFSAIFGGIIAAIFLIGLLLALLNAEYWGGVIAVLRDVLMIAMLIQGILIIVAISLVILQIAHFVNLLQSEVKPILDNAQETVKTAQTTAQFVSKNTVAPVVKAQGFFAGAIAFLRELMSFSKLLRRQTDKQDKNEGTDG